MSSADLPAPNPDGKLDLDTMLTVISAKARWRILALLAGGEGYAIGELGHALGLTYPAAYQHVSTLVSAGLIVRGRGTLYQIAPAWKPAPGVRTLDLGYCLLRFDHAASA